MITKKDDEYLKELRGRLDNLDDLTDVLEVLLPDCVVKEDEQQQIIISSGIKIVHQAGREDDRDVVFVPMRKFKK